MLVICGYFHSMSIDYAAVLPISSAPVLYPAAIIILIILSFVAGLVAGDPGEAIPSADCEVRVIYPGISHCQSVLNLLVTPINSVEDFIPQDTVNFAV